MIKDKLRTDLIKNYLLENNLSQKQFCKMCKIPYHVLKKMFRHDYQFNILYLARVGKAMKVQMKDMFEH